MRRVLLGAAMTLLTLSPMASAADQWADADALFNAREGSRDNMAQARAKYLAILDSATTNADKIRAVSQLGRLAIYDGEMTLPKTDIVNRKLVFSDCWNGFVEKIAPAVVGENPNYYYFKGVCLAYWGEAAGPLASLPYVPTLRDMISKAKAADTRFEGGGAFRLSAGVYSNPAARPVGLYSPNQAVTDAEAAVQLSAYPGDPSSGAEYYDNWRGMALCYDEAGRKDDAKAVLEDKIAELQDLVASGSLPAGRGPEAKWNLDQMQQHLTRLNAGN